MANNLEDYTKEEREALSLKPKKTLNRTFDKWFRINGTIEINVRFIPFFDAIDGKLIDERLQDIHVIKGKANIEQIGEKNSVITWYNPILASEEIEQLKKAGIEFC